MSPPSAPAIPAAEDGGVPASSIIEFAELLFTLEPTEDMLHEVTVLASRSNPAGTTCGITIARDGRPYTVASSGAVASLMDEVQYGQDDGPCLTALRTGTVVDIPDLAVERRWGSYPGYGLGHGVLSSLALPMTTGGTTLGALNLYGLVPRAFESTRVTSQLFASQAASAVSVNLRFADQVELTTQLREALSSRAVIDQAIGIVMGQRRCSPGEAFDVLRRASQHRNVKLRVLAAQMVAAVAAKETVVRPRPPALRPLPADGDGDGDGASASGE